jgi:7-keto-8-aminopelargonate synthetase-like enzyme
MRLRRARAKDPDAAILIVTEALFSMDTDGPDLGAIVALKQKYRAHLLLDIAHDFGVLGPSGAGVAESGPGYTDVDYIIGSFSKTFASIGGFVATDDLPSARAVQGYSGSYTFSNALIPAQLGAIGAALGIVFSEEGQTRRTKVLDNVKRLRNDLLAHELTPLGGASAMVVVQVGDEALARLAYRQLLADGVILNAIEFPAVRRGEARFRMQLTPDHEWSQLSVIAPKLSMALSIAGRELKESRMAASGGDSGLAEVSSS